MLINTNSKNSKYLAQPAGNLISGSSETIRKLSDKQRDWLAGVFDGDGNFDIQNVLSKRVLKQIRITQHPRDGRILTQVKTLLGGRIRLKGKKYLLWTISTKELMCNCLNILNGSIRIKVKGFKEACELYNINYIRASYDILPNSAYLAGLIDTDGTVVMNFHSNRIEVHLEFQKNEYSTALNFNNVIPDVDPLTYTLIKRNQNRLKEFTSIRFSFNRVKDMLPLYKYFAQNRLYSDFKYYRVMQIKRFLELRSFKFFPLHSVEYKIYFKFLKHFYTHLNEHKPLPLYLKFPTSDNDIVH